MGPCVRRDDSDGAAKSSHDMRDVRIPAMRELPVVHIFSCFVGQITTILPHVSLPQEGRFAIVTNVGSGMRWTRYVV